MEPNLDHETLLSFSSQLLGIRDFAGAREYALAVQESDRTRLEPAKIIAIADVLAAADDDWAAVLQLKTPVGDLACIRSQFAKLVTLLHPARNTFPFSGEAFERIWSAMKSAEKLKREDDGIASSQGTFWTVCPYCYCAHEYLSEYEDCCLRCQNCRRGFHGVAAALPPPATVEGGSGQEYYYCGYGSFPLKYEKPSDEKTKKEEKEIPVVMEISDDSEEEEEEEKEKEKEVKKEKKKTGKYMKSIPKFPRKVNGTGQSNTTGNATAVEEEGAGKSDAENGGSSNGDSELECLLKEDDVYVSLNDME
ncbi:hypothetical protein LINGRAHAP2_LOCUS12484 [Linum grandiflorum]